MILVTAVRDFLARHQIRRFRAIVAMALLGAWATACVILMYAHLTIPKTTSTSVGTPVTLQPPDANQAESILNSNGRVRELSANLSMSLRDGGCLHKSAVMTVEFRLSKDAPLFTALETGRLSSIEPREFLGDVVVGESSYNPASNTVEPGTLRRLPLDLDSVRIDKNSDTAIVSYRYDGQISSDICYGSLWIEYRCDESQYCPSNRAFTLTVGPALGIDHVVEGLADIQRRDRAAFSGLKPYQDVVVTISLRDHTVRTDTGTIEELVDVLSTQGQDDVAPYALLVPLVILSLSRTKRNSLDTASRITTSVVIYSMACALLFASFLDEVYSLTNWQPIEDAADVLGSVFEISTPSLALLILVSVFVAFPLTLSILVARSRDWSINRGIWILIIFVACGPLMVAAVTRALLWDVLSPQEVVLVAIVIILPIMVIIALRGIRWNLMLLSALAGILTAIFATSIFPDEELSSGVLALSFPLVAIPLCVLILSDRRPTTRVALPFVLATMVGVLDLVLVSFLYLEVLSDFPNVNIYEPAEWPVPILLTLELGLFVLLVSMMIGRTFTAASVGSAMMEDRRGVVMILTFLCAFVSTDSLEDPTLGSTLGVALSTLLFGFLVICRSAYAQSDLWNVSDSAHKRLVEREARRRTLYKVSRDHARDGKRRMSEGAYELRDFDRNQRIFDRRADPRQLSGNAQKVSLPEAALGSTGGFTTSQNARVACIFALVACLPAMLAELVGILVYLPEATVVSLGIFRWVIYACVFGYYYPAVRGATPTSKSLVLFVAVAIPEVVWLMSEELTTNEFMLLVAARLGQAAVLCFGLGLFWERRLVQAAGLGWGRIRDFRALRGLATPIITIAIAVATTVATGLAGATLTSIVQPPEDPNQTVAPAPPGRGPK